MVITQTIPRKLPPTTRRTICHVASGLDALTVGEKMKLPFHLEQPLVDHIPVMS